MNKYNLTYTCSKCFKKFDDGQHPGYFIVFSKCRGKTCLDCGRKRKLGIIKCLYENFSKPGSEGKSLFECRKCKKMTEYFFNGVCPGCFCEVQKKENSCVCPFESMEEVNKNYYCSFCEEFHGSNNSVICKNCAEKVNNQTKGAFYKLVLPRVFFGVIVCLLLGVFFFFFDNKKKQWQETA